MLLNSSEHFAAKWKHFEEFNLNADSYKNEMFSLLVFFNIQDLVEV